MISTIAFDADDTLVDLTRGVEFALATAIAELGDPRLTVAEFQADADELFSLDLPQSSSEIRREATLRTLARHGLAAELERMLELFFPVRFASTRPFPGVLETLAKLRIQYQLGYATNGHSEADRCGLDGQFAFQIYALRGGVPKKPDAGFFAAVADAAGAPPQEILYVGDTYHHDVAGPAAIGMRTVWLNRRDIPMPDGVRPDAVISDITQLPEAITAVERAGVAPM